MASSFFVSPFDQAALLSIDGFGDFVSTMWGVGRGNKIEIEDWVEFPHSMGMLYTAITQYLGFPKYGDEFKVMGLAPLGEPEYLDQHAAAGEAKGHGRSRSILAYFVHHSEGVNMTWEAGSPTLGPVFSPELETLLGPEARPRRAARRASRTSPPRCRRCSRKSCSTCCGALPARPG